MIHKTRIFIECCIFFLIYSIPSAIYRSDVNEFTRLTMTKSVQTFNTDNHAFVLKLLLKIK